MTGLARRVSTESASRKRSVEGEFCNRHLRGTHFTKVSVCDERGVPRFTVYANAMIQGPLSERGYFRGSVVVRDRHGPCVVRGV